MFADSLRNRSDNRRGKMRSIHEFIQAHVPEDSTSVVDTYRLRAEILWEELRTPLHDRLVCLNELTSANGDREIVNAIWIRQLKKLTQQRQLTINVLSAISEREKLVDSLRERAVTCPEKSRDIIDVQKRKTRIFPATLEKIDPTDDEKIVRRLVLQSIIVVESIISWRETRKWPEPFFWRGENYLLRMRNDVDKLSRSRGTKSTIRDLICCSKKFRPLSSSSLAVLLPSRVTWRYNRKSEAYSDVVTSLSFLNTTVINMSSLQEEREWMIAQILAIEPMTEQSFQKERFDLEQANIAAATKFEAATLLQSRSRIFIAKRIATSKRASLFAQMRTSTVTISRPEIDAATKIQSIMRVVISRRLLDNKRLQRQLISSSENLPRFQEEQLTPLISLIEEQQNFIQRLIFDARPECPSSDCATENFAGSPPIENKDVEKLEASRCLNVVKSEDSFPIVDILHSTPIFDHITCFESVFTSEYDIAHPRDEADLEGTRVDEKELTSPYSSSENVIECSCDIEEPTNIHLMTHMHQLHNFDEVNSCLENQSHIDSPDFLSPFPVETVSVAIQAQDNALELQTPMIHDDEPQVRDLDVQGCLSSASQEEEVKSPKYEYHEFTGAHTQFVSPEIVNPDGVADTEDEHMNFDTHFIMDERKSMHQILTDFAIHGASEFERESENESFDNETIIGSLCDFFPSCMRTINCDFVEHVLSSAIKIQRAQRASVARRRRKPIRTEVNRHELSSDMASPLDVSNATDNSDAYVPSALQNNDSRYEGVIPSAGESDFASTVGDSPLQAEFELDHTILQCESQRKARPHLKHHEAHLKMDGIMELTGTEDETPSFPNLDNEAGATAQDSYRESSSSQSPKSQTTTRTAMWKWFVDYPRGFINREIDLLRRRPQRPKITPDS